MRLLCVAAASLSIGLLIACGGDDKSARAEKLTSLKKKFDEEYAELQARRDKATTANEKRGIQTEMRELVALTADKALTIAKEDPKDETGFAAAELILRASGKVKTTGVKEVASLIDILTEHHAANPKVKELLPSAMRAGPAGEKLLVAVSEKNTDNDTKGQALYIRGVKAARAADEEEDDKVLAETISKAIDLLEKAIKVAPESKVGNSGKTIAELGKKEIEALKAITIVSVGKPAPEVESVTLEGKKVKLSDYKGKVVLLDVWATWCPPCRAMIPHERELVNQLKDKPFVLISVSADDKKETLVKFLEKEPMPWVHWWEKGDENPVLKQYRVQAFPSLYLIDHTGIVRKKWVGNPGDDKIDQAVQELVKEAVKAKS